MANEEPKTFYHQTKKAVTKPKPLTIAFAAIAFIVILFIFYTGTRKNDRKHEPTNVSEEMKSIYSKVEIENLIKEQLTKEIESQQDGQLSNTQESVKRKLNSKIAVFVKETPKESLAEVNLKQSQELKVNTGVKIKAHLANAVFSFNVSSPVIAVSDEEMQTHTDIPIPKGTQFIGEASVIKSRDRVNIRFSTMVFPDGEEHRIRAMALSLDGSGGIAGKVDRDFDKSLLKATGETILAGASLVVGARDRAITLEDELRLNTARNLTEDAEDALRQVKVEKSITIESHTPILILFLESI